jgi:prepilin-type processing-associated H-X9-DG protein
MHSQLNKAALVTFVLGISSLALSLVTALPALYVGLHSVRAINSSDGRLRGRRLAIAGLGLAAFTTVLTVIGCVAWVLLSVQLKSYQAACSNNLRQVGQAVNRYYDGHDGHFPSGNVPNSTLSPEQRLSWQAAMVSLLSEGMPAGKKWEKLAGEIAFNDAWEAPANAVPRQTNVSAFLCPSFLHAFSTVEPGRTTYVGVAGVGTDAAMLPRKDPRAGFFGYDRVISRSDISAGISSTMMVLETSRDNGSWLAGGPATVRGLDPHCDHYIGLRQPFGGLHPHGLNVLWADGSVRFRTDKISPADFRALARIAREVDE